MKRITTVCILALLLFAYGYGCAARTANTLDEQSRIHEREIEGETTSDGTAGRTIRTALGTTFFGLTTILGVVANPLSAFMVGSGMIVDLLGHIGRPTTTTTVTITPAVPEPSAESIPASEPGPEPAVVSLRQVAIEEAVIHGESVRYMDESVRYMSDGSYSF